MGEITFGGLISIIKSFSPKAISNTFRGEEESSYDDIREVIKED